MTEEFVSILLVHTIYIPKYAICGHCIYQDMYLPRILVVQLTYMYIPPTTYMIQLTKYGHLKHQLDCGPNVPVKGPHLSLSKTDINALLEFFGLKIDATR